MLSLKPLSARPISAAIEPMPGGLAAERGLFALTGQAVALRPARRIQAETLPFILSGQVVLFYVTQSQVALGNIGLDGTTATLTGVSDMRTNFAMAQGDTKTLVVTVTDAAGSPVNIGGGTIVWRAAKNFRKPAVISKAIGTGISITDGANGVFTVTLSPADTEDLVGDFFHEAQITSTLGAIATVLQGTMKVTRALIRA